MGILNVTPNSFYDGGKYNSEKSIVIQVKKMLDDGAAIIDIGAFSTKPNADNISEKEELKRIIPAIKLVKKEFSDVIISVDTFRAKVAVAAVESGAAMINDISGGSFDKEMFSTVASLKVPYILMHNKGTIAIPQIDNLCYDDLLKEVMLYFAEKTNELKSLGVADIIIDAGFGFAKNLEQNYELLNQLEDFKILELPMLVGISRKSMINKILKIKPEEALNGTTILNTIALMKGAKILRVHDVKEAVEAVKIVELLNC